jgi:hypothetical protein
LLEAVWQQPGVTHNKANQHPWQFPKECFGAGLLHERTQVPLAYPYILDTSTDIFGFREMYTYWYRVRP